MKKATGINQCFKLLTLCLLLKQSQSHKMHMSDFFRSSADLSSISWGRDVQTMERLHEVMEGAHMMAETTVVSGLREGSMHEVPIIRAKHASDGTSDLTLEEFLDVVIETNNEKGRRKGVKINVLQSDIVVPVLKTLKNRSEEISFPIWLSADVIRGPVDADYPVIDGETFIDNCLHYMPNITLSLGWTTRYGWDDLAINPANNHTKKIDYGSYTDKQLKEMYHLVRSKRISASRLVFPVRAGLAAESIDGIMKLMSKLEISSSIFIWSKPHDAVDMRRLEKLIKELGKTRCYVNLPFDFKTGPNHNIPDYMDDDGWSNDSNNDNKNKGNVKGLSGMTWVTSMAVLAVVKYIVY